MLDQKNFGAKLRNHRKNLGMIQEEAADRIGVSPQAISKWEAGDCLPDCFNLKEIGSVYKISLDSLLETESDGDLETVAAKIEQLGTEFVWAKASKQDEVFKQYGFPPHKQLGDDLWEMWKALYFIGEGDKKMQQEDKKRGNLRICGSYGLKIWDDSGVACVIKSSLIKNMADMDPHIWEVLGVLCSDHSLKLISILSCGNPDDILSKNELCEKTGIELGRLNELLLMLIENRIVEFVSDPHETKKAGYKINGACGIAAYMVMAAAYILNQKYFTLSEYMDNEKTKSEEHINALHDAGVVQ